MEQLSSSPYEVRVSPSLGRYLVASRDLFPRELLICEEPLIEGPTDDPSPDGSPYCLGCCIKMTHNPYSRCSKCHFPLCGIPCEEKESPHSLYECGILRKNAVPYPPPHEKHILNKSILILRCLLLKGASGDKRKWDQLMTMSDNGESRSNRPNCIIGDERIIENLSAFLPTPEAFDKGEVHKISGILDVNAHSYPVKVNGKVVSSKCHLYLETSLMSHSCSPNASWCPSPPNKLSVRANTHIQKGSIISVAYDDSVLLHGTCRRLAQMEVGAMFICSCERCSDPTEFGTYLSSLKCPSCPEGGYLLPTKPTDSFSDWVCHGCGAIVDEPTVASIIEEAEAAVGFPQDPLTESEAEQLDEEGIQLLKEFVKEYSSTTLHPNHYIIQEVNLRIVTAARYALPRMGEAELEDFSQRCASMLRVAEVLIPGFSEYKAFIQYQYFRALLFQEEGRRKEGRSATEVLGRYRLILQLQKEVEVFLQEKFETGERVKYVRERMGFVRHQIKLLENKVRE